MKWPWIFALCLSTAATSQPVQAQARSDGRISSLVGGLRHRLSVMEQGASSLISSIKENSGPVAADILEKTRQTIPEKLSDSDTLQSTFNKTYEIKTWFIEHPYQAAFYFVDGIVFFYPGLVAGPVFWTLGWTSTGPRARSVAAAVMARLGGVPSRGVVAYVQSSAMGGYGRPLVHSVTRAGLGIWGASEAELILARTRTEQGG